MKKLLLIILLIALVPVSGFSQSGEVEVYSSLYNAIVALDEQYSLLLVMKDQDISGAGEFYANALHRLVTNYQNIRTGGTATEKDYADKMASLLAEKVGEEKQSSAAADLWRVVDSFPNPLVRADAMMALGRIQAVEFLPQVIKVLTDLNMAPVDDRLAGERLAMGAVVGLEKYGDISGYLALYGAHKGWYGERVRNQALKSMEVVSPDPTEPMIQVIKTPTYSYEQKLLALQSIAESTTASNDSKSKVATAALGEGWRLRPSDPRQQEQLKMLRKNAMTILRSAGASDDAVYPLLEQSYQQYARSTAQGADQDECTQAIITLRDIASEEAAKRLTKFVMELLEKYTRGTSDRKEESLMREVIPALGATKQAVGRPALNAVIAQWKSGNVGALAQEALKQIP